MTKAVYVTKEGAALKDAPPVPTPSEGQVLIKNVVVASNPKDWKLAKWGMFEGIEGNDVAGHVEAVGSGVTEFKKGDKVVAFTPMATDNIYSAYQPYSVSPQHTVAHLKEQTPFEEAATIPLAGLTAAIGTFLRLQLPEPDAQGNPAPGAEKTTVLIWGASSSVGSFAVQLAKRAGFFVVGIAGAGAQYAKSLGADVVLDYRSETDLVSAIQKASPTPVKHAYDAISHPPTTSTIAKVLSANGGGRLTTVLPTPEETEPEKAGKPANVVLDRTMVGSAHKDDSEFASRWIRTFARWIPEGKFKGNVVKVIPGGLAGVPEGLKLLEENKVSGAKLVYRIAETPGL